MSEKPRKSVDWDFAEDAASEGRAGKAAAPPGENATAPVAADDSSTTGTRGDESRALVEGKTKSGPHVDVAFRVTGTTLPLDHGYVLFAAVAHSIDVVHREKHWGVHPVLGRQSGPGLLTLTPQSRLKFRLPAGELANLLPLAGAVLDVDGHLLQVGVPEILPLRPAASLKARFVTVKGFIDPETFAGALRRQLAELSDLGQDPGSVEIVVGPRRVIRVSSHTVVGFAVGLDGLEGPASLAVQVRGLGGRRHMGAGIFVPAGRKAG